MNLHQNGLTEPFPKQSALAQAHSRKVRRRVNSTALPTAWLVLLAALAMTVLEGAFRKWVPGFEGEVGKYLMYFSKDLIFAALLFYPKRNQPSPALHVFKAWLVPGVILLAVGASLSCLHGLNPVGAVLSLRALIILPVLAWLVVPRLAGLPLRWLLWLLAALTVANFALGVEQNRLPADHVLNHYAEASVEVVAVESGVRASGTFSYIAGLAIICLVGVWAGLALLSLARDQWQRIAAWVTLAAGVGCGLASVSRGPVVMNMALVGGWLVLSRDGISLVVRGLVIGGFCVVVAAGLGLTSVFTELGQGLVQRQATASDTFNDRAFGQYGEMGGALADFPLGHGFGTEQVGGQYAATGEANFNHYESPLPRLVMETGVLGLLGYLAIGAGAILALQTARRAAANSGAGAMLLATQLMLALFFYGGTAFNHTISAFVWILFAAVLASQETNENVETLKPETGIGQPERRGRKLRSAPFSVTGN